MKIIDEPLLAAMRGQGRCEYCLRWCKKREPHHIFPRSGGRLDIPVNLIALGSSRQFVCQCHAQAHAGELGREVLLEVVAAREGTTAEEIIAEIHRLRALPQPRNGKRAAKTAWQIRAGELRRARNRRLYRWWKELRKKKR